MSDIELMITIPKDVYKNIMAHNRERRERSKSTYYFEGLIRSGTLLPEYHGRLGDLDALEEEITGGINSGLMIDGYENYSHINNTEDCLECVKYADTIIKAHHPAPVKEKSKKTRTIIEKNKTESEDQTK